MAEPSVAESPVARTGWSLETWAVATFNVVTFGLLLVLAGHASGVLRDALPSQGTVPGVLVFGYLWVLVLVATRWVFADDGLARSRAGGLGALVARGVASGAVVGLTFVAGVALVAGLVAVVTGGVELTSVVLVVVSGSVVGAIGGAVVGLGFGLFDLALYRVVDALVGRPA